MPINIYVNKLYREYIDQLTVIAQAKGIPLSTEICEAVKNYIQNLNDEKDLLASDKIWAEFIAKANREELHATSRLLCGLNDRIVEKLCQ